MRRLQDGWEATYHVLVSERRTAITSDSWIDLQPSGR